MGLNKHMTPEIRAYMSSLGKRSLETMTPEQRTARAKKAVEARIAKKKSTKATS